MSKTNFINGTIVTSDFLNSIFNTSGGHVHDGGTDDGHADKLALADVNGLDSALGGLDGRINTLEGMIVTGTISVDVTSAYFDTPINVTWKYKKNTVTNEVAILIPDMFGHHTTATQLQFTPHDGNWPAAIVPATAQMVCGGMFATEAASSEFRQGMLSIPATSSANIEAYITDADAKLTAAGFGSNNTSAKGIFRQTIHYIAE